MLGFRLGPRTSVSGISSWSTRNVPQTVAGDAPTNRIQPIGERVHPHAERGEVNVKVKWQHLCG